MLVKILGALMLVVGAFFCAEDVVRFPSCSRIHRHGSSHSVFRLASFFGRAVTKPSRHFPESMVVDTRSG